MEWTNIESADGYLTARCTVGALLDNGRNRACLNPANAGILRRQLNPNRNPSWFGVENKDEAVNLHDWPQGLELANRYAAELPKFTMNSIARRNVWSDSGDEFDRDRFDAGQDAWSSRLRAMGAGRPVLTLTCAIGGRASHTAGELVWSGVGAFAVCDAAEEAGYRVEIIGVKQVMGTFEDRQTRNLRLMIDIKAGDEPLDRETAIMAMGHPAFYRYHILSSYLAMNGTMALNPGLGQVVPPTQNLGDLHMPHCYDSASAASAVRGLIRQIEAMADGTAVAA